MLRKGLLANWNTIQENTCKTTKWLISQTQPKREPAAPQYALNSLATSSLFGSFKGFRFSHLSWQKALQLGMTQVGHSRAVLIVPQPSCLPSCSSWAPECHGGSPAWHYTAGSGVDGDTPRRKPSLDEHRPARGLPGRAAPQQQEVVPGAGWEAPVAKRSQASGGLARAAARGWAGRERPSWGCCQPSPWAWPQWAGHDQDPDPIPSHTALLAPGLVSNSSQQKPAGNFEGDPPYLTIFTLPDPPPSPLSAREPLGFSPESG